MKISDPNVSIWVPISVFFVVTNLLVLLFLDSSIPWMNVLAVAANLFNLVFFWDDWVVKQHDV